MSTKVLLPEAGMGTSEATIARWLKSEGDSVKEGETIVEVETAKAIQEVPAPATGVITKILLHEGQTAEIRTEIAVIE